MVLGDKNITLTLGPWPRQAACVQVFYTWEIIVHICVCIYKKICIRQFTLVVVTISMCSVVNFVCHAYQGRQDPVVKLKKQLAEKEKALQEEQEAAQSLQSKLKELRSELNSERSRLTHSCRQLEESLVTKQNEIQSLAARLQHALESHVAEKQALTQQYQQVRKYAPILIFHAGLNFVLHLH